MTPAIASRPKVDASILRGRRSARFASSDNGLAEELGVASPRSWLAPAAMASQRSPGNAVLPRRGAPQPFRECAHHGDGEIGRLMHKEEEILFGDGRHLAFRLGARGRGPGRAVDQGHLAENSPRRHRLDHLAVAFDFDRAERTTYILSPLSPVAKI